MSRAQMSPGRVLSAVWDGSGNTSTRVNVSGYRSFSLIWPSAFVGTGVSFNAGDAVLGDGLYFPITDGLGAALTVAKDLGAVTPIHGTDGLVEGLASAGFLELKSSVTEADGTIVLILCGI